MAFTYTLSTAIGKTRLLIPDNDGTGDHIFEDDELQVFLDLSGANISLAAAKALEVIASDEAKKLKVGKVLDIQTDGAALGDFLLKRAARLRADATQADSAGTAQLGFAIAEQTHGEFGYAQLLEKERQRQNV
jgi:hypothetical protein